MVTNSVSRDQKQKVEAVVNYILKNLAGDLSLNTLAAVANYSPFHFQKLFTEIIGVSPKQYIIKTRIETACHFLVIQTDKPILEIAMDCGFSSPSVFSRAFKDHFGISAAQMRSMPHTERRALLHADRFFTPAFAKMHMRDSSLPLAVEVKRLPAISGICINTALEEKQIMSALNEMMAQASAHDLLTSQSKIIGIISPHHDIYRAFVSVPPQVRLPAKFNALEIKAGKYATIKMRGTIQETFDSISSTFYKTWLPGSGYRIADVFGYELFHELPSSAAAYKDLEREICIPIEPA